MISGTCLNGQKSSVFHVVKNIVSIKIYPQAGLPSYFHGTDEIRREEENHGKCVFQLLYSFLESGFHVKTNTQFRKEERESILLVGSLG